MAFFELTINQDFPDSSPLYNFEILVIKNTKVIYKIHQNEQIMYFIYTTKNEKERQLFTEVLNKSPLWNVEFTYELKALDKPSFRLNIKINMVNDFISEYINTSTALKLNVTNFDRLPSFEKTDFSTTSFVPLDDILDDNIIPKNFKVKLYDYQKRSISRMLKIEKNTTKYRIKYTKKIHLCDKDYIYDPILNRYLNEDKYLQVTSRGGVLSDEMGLGKTITTIGLISINTAPVDHPSVKFSHNYGLNKLFTKATLVLCPSHLIKQWCGEIHKCNPKFKILSVITKKDMDNLKVHDIQDADIVITSHQFLMNFKYYPSLHYIPCSLSSYNPEARKRCLVAKLASLLNDEEKLLTLETPIFEFFYWHRIVLDEGHEIFGGMLSSYSISKYMSEWVSSIDSNYYWYVSGTPFINYNGVLNASKFIKLQLTENEKQIRYEFNDINNKDILSDLFSFVNKNYIWNRLLNKICIRHRKCDVENQIQIPGYEEKIIWVKFTELEKKLYDSYVNKHSNQYLQQICCHPMLSNSAKKIFGENASSDIDLSLMQDKLIDYHKKRYEDSKKKLSTLDPRKHEYHMLKKTWENSMNESNYMVSILEKMKNNDIKEDENDCIICLDNITDPTLTECGHLFCYECIKLCLKSKQFCPLCKKDLSGKDLLTMKKNDVNVGNSMSNPLLVKYGSKLGKTISIVKSLVALPETKIIIFSQWDNMLSLIGTTLSENGIENSFVKGNVHVRNSAISKFKKNGNNDMNKVIMLSLKNSASGTNLTEATHILFVEPIDASLEECRAIEGQAIGRACRVGQKNKISVIRILIENSIEEKIYKSIYNERAVVEFKNDEDNVKDLLINNDNSIRI